MHCFLRCWSNSRADLVAWCKAVLQQLGDLERATRHLRGRAESIRGVIQEAACCIRQPTPEGWLAVRRVVGGALPPWDGAVPPSLEKDVAGHVEGLQVLFTQRLEDWARYMAVYGAARQGKWNSRGWMRLIFEAMRANAWEGRGRRVDEGLPRSAMRQHARYHGDAVTQGEGVLLPYCSDRAMGRQPQRHEGAVAQGRRARLCHIVVGRALGGRRERASDGLRGKLR